MKNKALIKRARLNVKGLFAAACALPFLLLATPVGGAGSQRLHGHVPAAVAGLQPMGNLAGTNQLNLAIGLPLRNKEALTNLLRQIYDPASPKYHHYLTSDQFTKMFGPTEKDYRAVIAFAKANGLTVTGTHPNRMLVDVNGPVANIESALHVTMRVYPHPKEARKFYAPDVEPSLDLAVPVLSIGGLDNYSLPRPRLQLERLNNAPQATPNSGSGPTGGYMGSDFRAAYAPDVTLNGTGQVVGLLQFDGYTASDITYYENQAGLPSVTLSNVLIDGASGNPSGGGGEVEVSLDIEMAISMAPGLSEVMVYMAPNPSPWEDLLNRMANDNVAKQLSCSWYEPGGAAKPTCDQIFQQMAAQGQSFFNASGDYDAYTGLISFPGDTPYLTQVGGTTLSTTGPGGPWASETVWNWGNGIGSGGGISTQYPIPSWQTNINMTANQGSTTKRNTPDVALTADNVYVRADGANHNVGGTSCAAPLWAGFAALVNQQAAASGKPAVGFINPAVDAIGSGANYTSTFHDITTGNNTRPGSPAKFYAVSGYDLCTGWGTPAGQSLIDALANPEVLIITPGSGFASIGGVGGPFTITSQSLSLTNAGTNSLTWTLVNTSLWLNASPSGGTLTPGGVAATVTVSLNTAASNLLVGTYSATLWFTNLNSGVGQSRQFTLAVISPPTITMQPVDQAVLEGATATFAVGATGGLPLYYQWQDNGTNLTDGGNISGSTSTGLTINNVSAANVGTYTVIITNYAGLAASSNALLTITPSAPVIITQPVNQTVGVGSTALFSVSAIGSTPLFYQWSFGGTNIVDATNTTLMLTNVQFNQAGNYAVLVTNTLGSVISSNAVLMVVPCDPAPAGMVAWWRAEGNANDSIGTNNGTPTGGLTYTNGEVGQAFVFNNTNSYIPVPASASLNVGTNNGFTIECWIQPNAFNVNVSPAPIIEWDSASTDGMELWSQFGALAVSIYDTSGNNYKFQTTNNLLNTNSFQHVALTYDKSSGLAVLYYNGVAVTNANFGSITPQTTYPVNIGRRTGQPIGNGDTYGGLMDELSLYNRALSPNEISAIYIAGIAGKCFTPAPPTIISQPTNQTVYLGLTANFNVVASGTPPLSYQWNFNGTNIGGATNTSLTLTNVQLSQAGNYAVLVTNLYGSILSSNAVLTVLALPPSISIQPTNQTVVVGGSVTFSVAADGTPPLSYQWNFKGTNIGGATNTSLTLTNVQLSQAGNYAVLVTNLYGSILSSNAVLTVIPSGACTPAPSGLVSWWRAEGNANDSIGTNNGTSTGGITYTNGEVGQAFVFNNTTSYIPVPASPSLNIGTNNGFTIECWIQPNAFNNQEPGAPIIEWDSATTDGLQLWSQGALAVNIKDTSGNAHKFNTVNGILTTNNFQHVALTYDKSSGLAVLYYNGVAVTNANFGSITPQTTYPVNIGRRTGQPIGNGDTYGGLMDELSLYNRALSPNEISAIYIAGIAGKCFTPAPPTIISQPTNQTVYLGLTANFNVVASGTPPLSYQWNFNGTNIGGATNTSLTLTNVQLSQAGNYAVLVTNLYGSSLSSNATLAVFPPGTCDPVPSGVVAWWSAEGNANDIIGTNKGYPTGGITYTNGEVGQAFVFNGSTSYIPIPASPSLNLGTGSGLTIECWIKPSAVNTAGSGGPLIEWDSASTDGTEFWADGDNSLFTNVKDTSGNAHRLQTAAGVINTNNWQHVAVTYDKGSGRLLIYTNGGVAASANVGSFTPQTTYPVNLGRRTGQPIGNGDSYGGLMDELSLYNRALSSNEIATIYNAGSAGKCPLSPPFIITQPTNQTVAVGGPATFSVTASGTAPLSYQWSFNGTNMSWATNASLTLTNVQLSQAGNYAVLVTNVYGSILSSNAVLTVNPLFHFVWNQIPSPRFVKTPFAVVVQALDAANGVATNFTNTVVLLSTNNVPVSPAVSGNFVQGVWTGAVTVAQTAMNLVLQASDSFGGSGLANPINIVNLPSLTTASSDGSLYILWPVNPSGFNLETTTGLSPANWVPVTTPPFQIGGQYLLPIQMSGTNAFYRLRFSGQ